jgi:hypothetical protein
MISFYHAVHDRSHRCSCSICNPTLQAQCRPRLAKEAGHCAGHARITNADRERILHLMANDYAHN